MKKATLYIDSQMQLGEGVLWDSRDQHLYWVDILGRRIFRHRQDYGQTESWDMERYVSKLLVAPEADSGFVLGMQGGLYHWNPETSETCCIVPVADGQSDIRTNDGAIDPEGGIWIGTMDMQAKDGAGTLYRYFEGQLTSMISGVSIPNGLAFGTDLSCTYFVDSRINQLRVYDFVGEGSYRVLVDFPTELGLADGMCIGPDGHLWIAHWGGHAVCCWDSQTGEMRDKISVPAPHVTSCTFGGPGGNELFITTAREGLSAQELEQYPASGAVFRYIF